MLDKKWICPKCGGDNTAFLPLVKKVTTYQLFRTGTQEYETFQIFASSSVADNAQPPQHTVYRCLDAPIFKSEPEKVNLDPAGLREHFVWRHLDKLGLYFILATFVLLVIYTYQHSFSAAFFYILYFIGGTIGALVVRFALEIIYGLYQEGRSNICLDCGHIYQPSREG